MLGATMANKNLDFLLNTQGSPVDPGVLETLGKEAAALANTSGLGMNEAVVQAIGKTKLNSEQVRRVVEFANHEAFHQKYSALDPRMRAVDIDGGPADPVQVLQDLNNGARPQSMQIDAFEYTATPKTAGTTMDFGLGVVAEERMTKTAALSDLLVLKEKLATAHEQLIGDSGSQKMQMQDSFQDLIDTIGQAKRAGLCAEDVRDAWASINPKLAEIASVRAALPSRGSIKVAQHINPLHPVITKFAEFARYAEAYAVADTARRDVESQLVRVNTFLNNGEA